MSKRIAVVTGGMGGIGQAICQTLHDQDMYVVAAYSRPHEAATAWLDLQKQQGYHFDIQYVDVTNFKTCEALARLVEEQVGPIDILVNNAGITRDRSCAKMNKDDWDIVINTDLSSIFYMTHAIINGMKERNFGRIINISSINGQKGQYGQVNYAAAKAGIHGFTKSLALEVAKHGITVNTVSPGYVKTDMIMSMEEEIRQKILLEIPLGRFAEPHDVARAVAFLADESNSYITGVNLAINGGHYMC
ncbi:MAG: acetoacetyl-CoA reductase [Gammaproteobacteria bacterium]|nr:acetoacetyl-CoA reductase [Gammaproteobacteria bacterium]